jgi:hypothetical protein
MPTPITAPTVTAMAAGSDNFFWKLISFMGGDYTTAPGVHALEK